MRHNNSKVIFNYWNNLRGERPAPDRREIEPSDIRNILGDTFILEVNQELNTISFRLAGTRICNSYGRELKGLGFLALWDELDNQSIYRAVKRVYEDCTPCSISYFAQTASGRSAEHEIILLPLNNSDDNSKRILGTASAIHRESWLGSDALINNRVKSIRFLDLEKVTAAPTIVTPIRFGQPTKASDTRRFGHLTVIDGGLG